MTRGALFVVDENAEGLKRGLRNIPGVDVCNVNRLNIRNLAPGGHLGRLCVWTQGAFAALEKHFGSGKGVSSTKKGYRLPQSVSSTGDIAGVINSDAVQSALNSRKPQPKRSKGTKANPLVNKKAMFKLNPYAKVLREMRKKDAGVKRKITKD